MMKKILIVSGLVIALILVFKAIYFSAMGVNKKTDKKEIAMRWSYAMTFFAFND